VTTPRYLAEMIRRPTPARSGVLAGTVPVVSFGDPTTSRVATLGINPSSGEFLTNGVHFPIAKRRLATLQSLGVSDAAELTDAHVTTVIDECNAYFTNRPYRKWFDPLDAVLSQGLDASYYAGSACHLDIVQWATHPVWSGLDSTQKSRLLEEGVPFLTEQLRQTGIRLVVVNGAQVWAQLAQVGLATVDDVAEFRFGVAQKKATLRIGEGSGAVFVGWTLNLQGSHGIRHEDRMALAQWLADVATRELGATMTTEEHLDTSLVRSKTEFADVLRSWFDQSSAETIGKVTNFGGKGVLRVDLGGGFIARLNADTKRAAVAKYLATVSSLGAEHPWRVVANTKGTFNKLEFTTSGPATPGWYCYLESEVEREQTI